MEKKSNNLHTNNINFRQAKLDDINKILEFDSLDSKPLFTESKLKDEISSSSNYCVVAIHENVAIGYSSMSIMYDHADILYVSVNKDFKRIGIAKNLVNLLIDRCTELKLADIFLEVRESNIPAISLYTKCGFVKISERKDYYNLPAEHAIILKREV